MKINTKSKKVNKAWLHDHLTDPYVKLAQKEGILTGVSGGSTLAISMQIAQKAAQHERVMVVLDSDHSAAHVTRELEAYAGMVTPGCFLVVEDTHYNDRPVPQSWMGGPGPGPALDAWLPQHPEFKRDLPCERFMMTFYPGGWLRRGTEVAA
mgnify:CR=1 FL=1